MTDSMRGGNLAGTNTIFGRRKVVASRMRRGRQEASSRVPHRHPRRSRLRHQRMREGRRIGRDPRGSTSGSRRSRRVGRRNRGRQDSRNPRAPRVQRQGSRHRRARVDHRQGRAAGRRGIRPCDAAAAHHAVCRRDVARTRCHASARGPGTQPGGSRGGGAARRLARIMVSTEDRCPHAGALRRRSAGTNAASDLGRGPAGLFYPGRRRSTFPAPVGIRDRPRHGGLATTCSKSKVRPTSRSTCRPPFSGITRPCAISVGGYRRIRRSAACSSKSTAPRSIDNLNAADRCREGSAASQHRDFDRRCRSRLAGADGDSKHSPSPNSRSIDNSSRAAPTTG